MGYKYSCLIIIPGNPNQLTDPLNTAATMTRFDKHIHFRLYPNHLLYNLIYQTCTEGLHINHITIFMNIITK